MRKQIPAEITREAIRYASVVTEKIWGSKDEAIEDGDLETVTNWDATYVDLLNAFQSGAHFAIYNETKTKLGIEGETNE